METVTSADGTPIGFTRSGAGPPLVLVHGAIADRTRWAPILPELQRAFTVIAMDRRGRGASGDSVSYSLEREVEDVVAVVTAAGPDASLLGHSYGSLCAMEAAPRINNLRRLILYEADFRLDDAPLTPPELRDHLAGLLAKGDREAVLEAVFSKLAGATDQQIAALRADPSWQGRIAAAHTVLREIEACEEYRFDPSRFSGLNVPTLLLLGEESGEVFAACTRALDAALPDSRMTVLEGQGHIAMSTAPQLFLREVTSFLAG